MSNGNETLYTFITGGTITSIAYLVGGIDNLSIALGIFMICDYITGMSASFYEGGFAIFNKQTDKGLSSKKAFKGLSKKVGMITFVIIANQLDIIAGNTEGFMRNAMIMFLIGAEGISILENVGRMGVQVPEFILSALQRMKGSKEENK